MRKNIIAGNWKMNLNRHNGIVLVENVLKRLSLETNIEVIFAPSFVHLYKVKKLCSDRSNVYVAAQDCSINDKGAFTGEVSAEMIASCGAQYVILGHSERRVNFNETNDINLSKNVLIEGYCKKIVKLSVKELEVHKNFLKQSLKKNYF